MIIGNLNSEVVRPSATTLAWLNSDGGHLALKERAQEASGALLEAGLVERLRNEAEASQAGGSKVFRIGNSLRLLTENLAILVVADQFGVKVAPEAWEAGRVVTETTLALDRLVFQGRTAEPPWKADLWTADVGINLAVASHFNSPLQLNKDEVGQFLESKAWRPINEDWIAGSTRIHSLDSMGHNWWSVIVGGAGIISALLDKKKPALETCSDLAEWFSYPGNVFARKNRNFGNEGDFVEGFAYGEYAMLHPFILGFLLPEYPIVPAWLSSIQCHGLTAWYKRAFLQKRDGTWWPQRFGDIHMNYHIRAEVWHTLARTTGDEEFLALAHQLKPHPRSVFEFLMWEPFSPTQSSRAKSSGATTPRDFQISGLAFLGDKNFTVTVRAGEFWNHNHLDAGSFIYHENGVVWVDDSGVCMYNLPEYVAYYATPKAHNVAYVPDLVPDPHLAHLEGLPLLGRLLFHQRVLEVEVLGTDTSVLSAGSLARSHRLFLVLDDAVTVIWDDLQAHHPQSFEFLLHTTCGVEASAQGTGLTFQGPENQTCPLSFFSTHSANFISEPAPLGDRSPPDGDVAIEGTCLRWRTEKNLRQKFGLAMGSALRAGTWKTLDSGWECSFQAGIAFWHVWFNLIADGSVMHKNSIGVWQGIETDAYALLLREEDRKRVLFALQSSFVRQNGKVFQSSLHRMTLTRIDL